MIVSAKSRPRPQTQPRLSLELAYAEVISYNKRTLRGSFRTKADSITDNKTKRNGGRKKFNEKVIEM